VDWRRVQAATGLKKFAERTRTMLESLVAMVAADHRGAAQPPFAAALPAGAAPARQPGQAPPCLALFGEFSAGKSSLANLLLGVDMLPTSVLSSTRLPTRLRHAERFTISTVAAGGERQELDLHKVKDLSRQAVREVEIGLPDQMLREFEILDTPGFADPYHDPDLALAAGDQAHLAIWCTLATQAWRQTEQLTWRSLPARLRSTGILVVTHCDVLRNEGDRQQLLARLQRQAAAYFRAIVLLSVPDAMRARAAGDAPDPELWEQSGGAQLLAQLHASLAVTAQQRRRAAARAGRRPAEQPAAPVPTRPVPVAAPPEPARASSPSGDPAGALAAAMVAVPDCQLAAWVDLVAGRPLAVRTAKPAPPSIEADAAALAAILLRGPALDPLRGLAGLRPGRAAGPPDPIGEVTLATSGANYLLLRSPAQPERALLLATAPAANLGLARLKARRLLAEAGAAG
jgi:hypothetical protein